MRNVVLSSVIRAVLGVAGGAAIAFTSAISAELPQPCTGATCGAGGPATWVTSGSASGTLIGNHFRIDQQSQNAILNWRSFNVGADGSVEFRQPGANSVALNRIFQQDPSRILGTISANGQVYLINTNGIVFGDKAKVNVGGLVASSLDITQKALDDGIARAAQSGAPAFAAAVDAQGRPRAGAVTIERGATIQADGGQVLVFAPEVTNRGVIRTPDGQTVLAAGSAVYLAPSADPNLRGLLVQVDGGGTVVNGEERNRTVARPEDLVGQIVSERGNVTLAGLVVKQLGRVSATTSVNANGTVRLQATDGIEIGPGPNNSLDLRATRGGDLTVGERAVTEVLLDADDDGRQVDVNAQARSSITLEGRNVALLTDSRTVATAGEIVLSGRTDPRVAAEAFEPTPDDSRVYLAPGAIVDVSGADIELPMENNVLRVELRGTQLADSPLQRDGVLRGETIYVDTRRSGVRADGSTWVGTPLADLAGDFGTIQRTVGERSLAGGSIRIQSQGAVLIAPEATLDVSGGSIRYLDGYLNTTQLVSNGRPVDIAVADPNLRYGGIVTSYSVTDQRWGITRVFPGFARDPRGGFEPGYVEGKDAGRISLVAPAIALDGRVDGSTVRGPRQRQPAGTIAAGNLYRPVNQAPLGARLEIGNLVGGSINPNRVVGDATFEAGLVMPGLKNADGGVFDPLTDEIPETLRRVRVRPELLEAGAVARLVLRANGSIELPTNSVLQAVDDGSIDLAAAQVNIAGDIVAPSGTITIVAEPTSSAADPGEVALTLRGTASLLARGRWVNDNPALVAGQPAALHVDGGSVTLIARQGDLHVEAGSLIDVSGGGFLDAAGRSRAGAGGNVSIGNTPATDLALPSAATLLGEIRGHSLDRGGRLSLTFGSICIGDVGCTGSGVDHVVVAPDLLESSGFGSYALASNRGGIELPPGTALTLRQVNRVLADGSTLQASAADVLGFSTLVQREAALRRPVNLSLGAAINPGGEPYINANFNDAPGLSVGAGASIEADPTARIALSSNSWMVVDGRISAPAGEIALELTATLRQAEFLDAQGIWLGAGATLAAPGNANVITDDAGLRSGEVLDGGSISVAARRGYVVTLPGAMIDVSGTAATLDLRSSVRGTVTTPTEIASSGGAITLLAAEGILQNGTLRAAPGAGSGAAGGALSFVLDPSGRVDPGSPTSLFPLGARTISLSNERAPVIVAARAAIPRALNGTAYLDARTVREGGFDTLDVRAAELFGRFGGPLTLASQGRIESSGDAGFTLPTRITLDAARIGGGDGRLHLVAPYVSLGNSSRLAQPRASALEPGTASLLVEASLIDLIGHFALDGIASAHLAATGDIRARGVQRVGAQEISGSMLAAGDLRLQADQIYPVTLSDFEIGSTNADGRIDILPGGARGPVYSAGGSLLLTAPTIRNAGALVAPFGQLALRGDSITLAAGSVTSTSGAGTTIPFGETQGGFDWTYSLLDRQTLVVGSDALQLPQQNILLDGRAVDLAEGATIDLSGGGDLLAYEWIPGVGGTIDVLDPAERPGQFAILPQAALAYAPFDPSWSEGTDLVPGAAVHLAGADGVPAGTYVLLPARYALLPGAYLVSAVEGYQDILPGETHTLANGATVVAGYRTVIGSDRGAARFAGYAIRPGSAIQTEADYTTSLANEFFAERAELTGGSVSTRLPRDAGVLALAASESLALAARLVSQPAADGRGAGVDISSARLRVGGVDAVAVEGEVLLDAAGLAALGAESLLLGGRRETSAEGLRIEVDASSVSVDAGVTIEGQEVILAARDGITLGDDARLEASGTNVGQPAGDVRLLLEGDGALLRVATRGQVEVARSQAPGVTGSVLIGTGAVLSASGGSITVDATRDSVSRGRFEVPDGSLSLNSSRINLGDVTTPVEGIVLGDADLQQIGAAELILGSRSTIDLYGSVELLAERLVLQGGGLRAMTDDVVATLRGEQALRLENPADVVSPTPAAGSAQLELSAGQDVELGTGAFAFDGFAIVTVAATRDLVSVASGTTATAGALELQAGRVTSLTGIERRIEAGGELRLTLPGTGTQAPATAPQDDLRLGGTLDLVAGSITHAGNIDLPSGRVRMTARGATAADGIQLAEGSIIDVSGSIIEFDGVELAAPGGAVYFDVASGDLGMAASATIDVSAAAAGGDAGMVAAEVARGRLGLGGELLGTAGSGGRGGTFLGDALIVADFSQLNASLNAGGFDERRDIRQRGAGSLVLGATNTLRAREVRLVADRGNVEVVGTIDARAPDGGSIELYARDLIQVSGQLLASATTAAGAGGSVLLASGSETTGAVLVSGGALVDVSGGAAAATDEAQGMVAVRVARERLELAADGGMTGLRLDGRFDGVERVMVEGFRRYADADGILDEGAVAASMGNALYADAQEFMTRASAIENALGSDSEVRPGIEIQAPGDLVLAADWDLNAWRFDGAPGVLTLRAGGDLLFQRSLSDGMEGVASFVLPEQTSESWSYRLVAGADLAAADPLAVLPPQGLAGPGGSLRIAPGDFISTDPFTVSDFRMIRTGTGDITIRAARDVVLGNQASVIYAAGVSGTGIRITEEFGGLYGLPYPTGAGDIDIAAGGNVVGALSPQLFTDWLWRAGAPASNATGWTVSFARFEQGVLSVGGDVRVRAGGNVENLSVSTPAIGRQVGGLAPGQNRVEIVEGGDIEIEARGSILGGTYLVGLGSGRFIAGDAVAAATLPQALGQRPLGSIFGLMGDAQLSVAARGSVQIETIVNPTLIPQGLAQNAFDFPTFFSTYGEGARADITSTAGNVTFSSDAALVARSFASLGLQPRDEVSLRVLPPSLRASALAGDVELLGPLALFPAPKGNIEIFAGRDVTGTSFNPVQILLSDADPDYLPTVSAPQSTLERVVEVLSTPLTSSPNFHAAVPIHADSRQPDGVPDITPARVVARQGSIRVSIDRVDDTSGFYFSKAARFIAGQDILELGFTTQHLRDTDVTTVQAGGDIRYQLGRTASGSVSDTRRELIVDGPGRLELIAGGDVNLQTSGGVTTRGNLRVPGLAEGGASVSVTAGLNGLTPDYAGFTDRYLVEDDKYDAVLIKYVSTVTGVAIGSKAEALQQFAALPVALRAAFIERVYFTELRDSGRDAAASPNADYSAAFTAIETLFPGANPDVDAGETNAYSGDLLMFFSRIYTLDGGDIRLMLPGGEINVGLASPPAAFGLQKSPSQLGLVAQSVGSVETFSYGDFSVNESRVFAADGGDILVWSTRGDIDAGRGAKTAISAPAPTITFDPNGNPQITFPAALTGSGIQTIATSPGRKTGDVDLYAPRGIVNAGDAGIVAGNLTIGATAVLGADNIQVTGVSVGVPVDSGGLGASLTGVSSVGSSASQAGVEAAQSSNRDSSSAESDEGEAAMSWLDVFVVGLGDESCDPKDLECLRRQKK